MVERYEFTCLDCDPETVKVNLGRWVRYSDYEAVQQELAEARAERDDWRASSKMYEQTAAEAARGLEALSDIDEAWDAFGTAGNRNTLTLAEQIASRERELEAAEALARQQAEAAKRIAPYLRWTVSDESPGHHPTMPSAVATFLEAFALSMKADPTVKDEISIRLQKRIRFEGDTEPPFWQADVWPFGQDYHAVGDTPQEALLRLAKFWHARTASGDGQ